MRKADMLFGLMPASAEETVSTGPILGIDTSSPTISVAVVAGGSVLATRSAPQRAANEKLLRLLEESIHSAGLRMDQLAGLAVLRGPGSFTGLRIGLATALGIHQSTALPTAAISTLSALAAAGVQALGLADGETIVSAVDALRDEWTIQRFTAGPVPRSEGPSERVSRAALEAIASPVVGHGLAPLDLENKQDAPELAAWAARLAALDPRCWDPSRLVAPLYARPPAVTAPRSELPLSNAAPSTKR